jgi:hypothetical protein
LFNANSEILKRRRLMLANAREAMSKPSYPDTSTSAIRGEPEHPSSKYLDYLATAWISAMYPPGNSTIAVRPYALVSGCERTFTPAV